MAYALRVSPETAPPSFEKGILPLTSTPPWFVCAPFYQVTGRFFVIRKGAVCMVKLVESPIDPAAVYHSICSAFSGSVVFHYAVVKKQACSGKSTTSIEYKAVGDTIQEMESIAGELERFWKLEDVLLIRRTGRLAVGDIISLVAASSPNSNDTFDACKFGINRLRRMVTIVKREKLGEIK